MPASTPLGTFSSLFHETTPEGIVHATRIDHRHHYVLAAWCTGPKGPTCLAEVICQGARVLSFAGACPVALFSRLLLAGGQNEDGVRTVDPGPHPGYGDDDNDDPDA